MKLGEEVCVELYATSVKNLKLPYIDNFYSFLKVVKDDNSESKNLLNYLWFLSYAFKNYKSMAKKSIFCTLEGYLNDRYPIKKTTHK